MQLGVRGVWSSFLMTGGIVLAFSGPAAAGEVYSWRTEDGGYAFADDIDAVPERYREEVDVRRTASLSGYRRYTAEDEAAAGRYEEGLGARLEHLRASNGTAPEAPARAAAGSGSAPDYVTVRSGSRRGGGGVDVSTPSRASDAPLEVETVYMRRKGGLLTQPVRVTKRGGQVVSIEKPRNRTWNLDDAVSESDLDALLEE